MIHEVMSSSHSSHLDRGDSGVLNVQTGSRGTIGQIEAGVVCEHMAGQVTGRTGLAIDVRHWSNDVAPTEIIQLQRTQLTDVPQNC